MKSPTPPYVSVSDVEAASDRLRNVARITPLEQSDRLSALVGGQVWIKREDLQLTRSYKIRGSYNFIASLEPSERERGVVCASAGNHAQGFAFSCNKLKIPGRIFVPGTTPRQKRQRIQAFGGDWVEVIVTGGTYDDAGVAALRDADERGSVLVHPFDDLRTMAGQGTVATDLIKQCSTPPDAVVVPVGGGGLVSGMSAVIKERFPNTRIIAVEPLGAASATAALESGAPVRLPDVDTFIDGAAVACIGEHTFPAIRDLVDEVVTVPEGAVCTEMIDLFQVEGIVAEPAGALATAALRKLELIDVDNVVCVISGGNNDLSRYGEIAERSLVHEGLKHYFLVTFPQEPRALRTFLDTVLSPTDDITLFEYVKKNNRELGPALVGIELASPEDLSPLLERMKKSPLHVEHLLPGSPLFAFIA